MLVLCKIKHVCLICYALYCYNYVLDMVGVVGSFSIVPTKFVPGHYDPVFLFNLKPRIQVQVTFRMGHH